MSLKCPRFSQMVNAEGPKWKLWRSLPGLLKRTQHETPLSCHSHQQVTGVLFATGASQPPEEPIWPLVQEHSRHWWLGCSCQQGSSHWCPSREPRSTCNGNHNPSIIWGIKKMGLIQTQTVKCLRYSLMSNQHHKLVIPSELLLSH